MQPIISLDIIVGYYLPGLFGWTFLVFVIAAETLLLSKFLRGKWLSQKVLWAVMASNAITTIIGYFLLDEEKNGGHLLNWIPVDHYQGVIRIDRTLFLFFTAFIGTVLVETTVNLWLLRKRYGHRNTIQGTILVNAFTYIAGGLTILFYNMLS